MKSDGIRSVAIVGGGASGARYWEIVAAPDIRDQAAAVADDIERELAQ